MIKVVINGAKGNMGQSAVSAVSKDSSLNLVDTLDINDSLVNSIQKNSAEVVVDLTHPNSVFENVSTILKNNAHAVVGTTGLTQKQLEILDGIASASKKAVIVCPNFAIGAILMMKFAAQAAKYMQRCEIIEYHHDKKADAPSGTAIKTAEIISKKHTQINSIPLEEKELIKGARGAKKENIPIHSIRVPGIIANQDIIFGSLGQTLTIKHETVSRDAFMPGLILAIKATSSHSGLVYGLEHLLD